MPEQLLKVYMPVKARWDALQRDQKIKLSIALGVILLALIMTIFLLFRTTYERFIGNLSDGTEIRAIQETLDNARIKNKLSDGGTAIYVDKNRLTDAKIELDVNPVTANIPFTYEDALRISGMSTTESQKNELSRVAKQSEIEMVLRRLPGITDASVTLSIPQPRSFIQSDRNASEASVVLILATPFSRSQGEAVARHVSRAVEGLLVENVEVSDQNLNVLYSGSVNVEEDAVANIQAQRSQERREIVQDTRNIFSMFDNVYAQPNLVYSNVLEQQEYRREIAPPVEGNDGGIARDMYTERSNVTGSNVGGEPGLGSNDYTANMYETGTDNVMEASTSIMDVQHYDVNETETHTRIGASSYDRDASSMSITFVKNRDYSQTNFMAADSDRRPVDWEIFKQETEIQLVDDPDIDTYILMAANGTGLLPSNITVLVYEQPFFFDDMPPPISIEQIIMFALAALLILMLALGLIRRKQEEEIEEEMEPELSVEELLVNTQLEEAIEESEKLEEIDYFKESEVKKQIEKFVNEKPDAVASLLRSWINNEEW